ncbi:MAG: hypothetical protein GX346_02450 [Clostridiales bacterium]|nr:hypothetical protein [Clostridiales bacterium]
MKPLLEITTVPVSIEINVTHGTFEHNDEYRQQPKMKMNVKEGGLEIQAEPATLKIDTYKQRASVGEVNMKTADLIKKNVDKAYKIAYDATAKIVNEGNMLEKGMKASEIAVQNARAGYSIETVMDFLPKTGPEVSYNEGKLNINYEIDDIDIEWENIFEKPVKFIPGKIEIQVEQMPKVEIEYVGDPIYFPKSSDPNYEPRFSQKA